MVSVGNFKISADDPAYPIPADSNADKILYLLLNNALVNAPAQHVRVVITDTGGKIVSDKEYSVGLVSTSIKMPKGTNLATCLAGAGGPCDQRIGFWLE